MWPFLSHALFPPPTQAWLQRASSDPEAQGWGAWSGAKKPPLEPGGGDRKEEEPGEAEEDAEDAGFPLSLLEGEDLAEYPVPAQEEPRGHPASGPNLGSCWQELDAIRLKLWAMEQAQGPEPPGAQGPAGSEEGAGAALAWRLLSPEAGGARPGTPMEKVESDHRSVYVGNGGDRTSATPPTVGWNRLLYQENALWETPGGRGLCGRPSPAPGAVPVAGGLRGHSGGARSLLQPLRGSPPGHHPVRQVLRTPQGLRLHRVCCRELSPGRSGVGRERLPRPSHQGAAQKDQLARDQLNGPRGLPRTARRQRRAIPAQQPPGRGPLQTSGAEPGPRKVLSLVFTVLKGGSDFESGPGVGQE